MNNAGSGVAGRSPAVERGVRVAESPSSAHQYHLRDGDSLSVRDGEERSDNQEAASVRGCASVEHQLRRSAVTDHFHVVPQHTCGVAGAKRFA